MAFDSQSTKPSSSITGIRPFGFMAGYSSAVVNPHHPVFAAGLDAFVCEPKLIGAPDDFLYIDGGEAAPVF